MTLKKLTLALAFAGFIGSPFAIADVGYGLSLSYVYGSGGGWAFGPKLFSDDKDDKFVGSLGVDYMLNQGTWRPNVGIGDQKDNLLCNANVGYNYPSNNFNFGIGVGITNTDEDNPAPALPSQGQEPSPGAPIGPGGGNPLP